MYASTGKNTFTFTLSNPFRFQVLNQLRKCKLKIEKFDWGFRIIIPLVIQTCLIFLLILFLVMQIGMISLIQRYISGIYLLEKCYKLLLAS